ncbi:TRAP transporter substrate-binding protein [Marinobacter sp. GN3S48]|uniref:TRAP transporter substrate-binding protein n=1 Tax=Marinobacter sp. GN3S48 TaxID=3382302 RepID=UPI00387B44AD
MLSRLSIALCCTLALSSTANANSYTLRVSHFLPASSNAHANVIEPWCEKLEADSDGRLQCQIYPSMQLGGSPSDLADMARNGVADIVWTAPGYSPGKFPRTEALELPFLLPYGGVSGNDIIWEFYQQHAYKDYSRFKVLALFGDGGMDIHTRETPINSLADLQGLKLRASGRIIAETLDALGATPVSMPPAQMTESIAKGVVDGAVATWEVVPPTKLNEVTNHHTQLGEERAAFGYTILAMLMSKRTYDRLPEDLREIINDNSGEPLVRAFGEAWDKEMVRARSLVDEESVTELIEAHYNELREQVRELPQQWAKRASEKGLDGETLVETVRELSSVD